MGSRVLTACSFRSKSIPRKVFHRCRSAEALRLFRVPAVYLTWAFLWFFSILLFRRINNLRRINPPEGFDSHPGHQFPCSKDEVASEIPAGEIARPLGTPRVSGNLLGCPNREIAGAGFPSPRRSRPNPAGSLAAALWPATASLGNHCWYRHHPPNSN